jgi:ketosteroid isomerase-like protein
VRRISEQNVEIVRRIHEIGQLVKDPGARFDQCVREGLLAPDAEWRGGTRGGRGIAGLENAVGRDEYAEMMRRFTEGFEDLRMDVEQIVDAGNDRVVAITRLFATGMRSGAPVELRSARVHWLDAGRVVRIDEFLDPADALKAVGLSE